MIIHLYRACPAFAASKVDPGQGDHDLLARLEASPIFQDYQRAFRATTGLPLVLQPAGAVFAPLPESEQLSAYCLLLAAQDQANSTDIPDAPWNAAGRARETLVLACPAGLRESAVPIRLGLRAVGCLRTGPVLSHPPTSARFAALLRRLHGRPDSLAVARLRSAYLATRVLPPPQYDAVLRLLVIFSQHLALLGNQLMLAESALESPPIAKARLFIAAHLNEELTVAAVAAVVHLSQFYFCRMFKRETGLTFTRHLARQRIEQVKLSLRQRHVRITQAAYDAGFQSLSQFNRVFRHVVGESPSAYRHRLDRTVGKLPHLRPLARTA
ncbi:MAG: AraC family transcriptional regulator [Lacunisphaera sp.]|nr:AraC family transcriptional regulator [Lacunisphaera sp.]